ncbi:hypothetical protein [Streptomyces subrutilus]|uniref:Uncharacterized protein n=1 Tax=Streptomyces subrutilus TaxID=36818 RepID=A0A1E5PT44_9ACTN|nr:hypothetical protein [Streptomyces subrutilus]OEJ32670.1 hypothetical protein BGK67_16235 [Streptomyces subrutilus]
MTTPTMLLSSMAAPLMALRIFEDRYRRLPAPCVSISTVYPNLLELSFHDNPDGFEMWRQALGIPRRTVQHRVQGDGRTCVMEGEINYSGGPVRLIGFTTIPALEGTRSRGEVTS